MSEETALKPVVLVVDDEVQIRRLLRIALEANGYRMIEAAGGQDGLTQAATRRPDVVLLDLGLPDLDGVTVIKRLREWSHVPVVVLSVRERDEDKIAALDQGADDYLTKPFELQELFARLRALIRRAAGRPSSVVEVGDVRIDTVRKSVSKAGQPVALTAREYALVEYLALHRGELVTRSMLYDHLFDEDDDSLSNLVDVHVSNVRKKLGKDIIATRRGQGYVLDEGGRDEGA